MTPRFPGLWRCKWCGGQGEGDVCEYCGKSRSAEVARLPGSGMMVGVK